MKRKINTMILLGLFATCFAQISIADDFGGGDILYDKPVKGAIFSHEYHVQEMGFDCESCHDEPFEMEAKAAQKDPNFTMQSMEEGLYCGECHDGSTAFSAATSCARCHIGVKGLNRALGITNSGQHH